MIVDARLQISFQPKEGLHRSNVTEGHARRGGKDMEQQKATTIHGARARDGYGRLGKNCASTKFQTR